MPTTTENIDIPIKDGHGTASIKKYTAGKTLSGKITIATDLIRIDTLPTDPVEEWTIALKINGNTITTKTNIKNGQEITQENITTTMWGNTEFAIDLTYSIPHDFTAKIKLDITY